MAANVRKKQFKVQWRFQGKQATTMDFLMESFEKLLDYLGRHEGVTAFCTEYLCVHEVHPDGSVTELLFTDKAKRNTNAAPSTPTPLPKPRIKLRSQPKDVRTSGYIYHATRAVSI